MSELKLAINMRELRNANKYSQQYVSDLIHIARQTYSLYETGKRIPDTETVCNLAELYRISVDSLLYADFSGNQIAEAAPAEHTAILPDNSSIRLTGAEAKMLMDYKAFPSEIQREVREYVRFKKYLIAKDN